MSNTKKCSRCLALNYDGEPCSFCGNGAGTIQSVTPEPMRVHHLKTHPEPFGAILDGDKNFEFRKNDRDFAEADLLVLQEYDPAEKTYTGRTISARVGYILRAPYFGVPKGYVCFSLLKIQF
jgi:Domain of unknown function (DUF3850)